jgi:hypothetical protein
LYSALQTEENNTKMLTGTPGKATLLQSIMNRWEV